MKLIIDIDPESNVKRLSVDGTKGILPVILDDSVTNMADHLVTLREIHEGLDVDILYFADLKYLGDSQ